MLRSSEVLRTSESSHNMRLNSCNLLEISDISPFQIFPTLGTCPFKAVAAAHLDSSSHHSAGLTSSLDSELFGEIDDFQAAVVPNSAERASQITFDLAGRYVDTMWITM